MSLEREILGKINMEQYMKEIQKSKEMAVASLRGSFPESPEKPAMTLQELRAEWDRQPPEVSLSQLIMDEEKLGY